MTTEKAFEIVKAAVLETNPSVKPENIIDSASLKADFSFDSLDIVVATMAIEDKVHCNMEDKFEKLNLNTVTVRDIVFIVEEVLG